MFDSNDVSSYTENMNKMGGRLSYRRELSNFREQGAYNGRYY